MARLSADDWIQAGLELMARRGESALTLEGLCTATGKTRGSFYHHFRDMGAYIAALLQSWRLAHTESVIALANQETDPTKRLQRLDKEVAGLNHRLDQIIRRWADYQPAAKKALQAVDEQRIGFIAECLHDLGSSREDARIMAELEYLVFLGAQQLAGYLGPRRSKTLQQTYREALELYRNAQ